MRGESVAPLTLKEAANSLLSWVLVGGRWAIGRVEEVGENEIVMRNQVIGLDSPVKVRRGNTVIVKYAPKQR